MANLNLSRTATTPIPVQRSTRVWPGRALTSLPAGKVVPILAVPLLREDSVRSGRLRFSFEMMETAEVLMNAVFVDLKAYIVPMLALERFDGMDALNRSYAGEAVEGLPLVPYIETAPWPAYGENDIYVYLGLHGRQGQNHNTAYLEAYNAIWNFRAKNRSADLYASTARTRLQADLAPAFWHQEMFSHIVPDFDQAVIDGEVPLNMTASKIPVQGIGLDDAPTWRSAGTTVRKTDGTTEVTVATSGQRWTSMGSGDKNPMLKESAVKAGWPDVFVEMENMGLTVSLSNIELAKKTQAFARMRAQYAGHSDEYLIDLLMDGITIPEQAYNQPMLIGEKSTIFGMSKRYASDGANLTESVVNGATMLDMSIQVPRIPMGGVIMITAEITPEQLFERKRETFLHTTHVDQLPHYLRDTLDPEKVEAVPCEYVDMDHNTPAATFGYAPLNYGWNETAPRIGGKFYRPEVDAGFDEDRQRLWAVETANPTLSADFYICRNIHTKPFVVTNQDPFELVVQGDFLIEGNTVFGGALVEAQDDYAKVLEKAPMERIEKP